MSESFTNTSETVQQHLQDFVSENRRNFENQTKYLTERKPLYSSLIDLYLEEINEYERSCEKIMEEIIERGERRLDYLGDVEEQIACRNYMQEMKEKLDSMKNCRLNFLQNQIRTCQNRLHDIDRRVQQNENILSDPRNLDLAMNDGVLDVGFLEEDDLQLSVWISRTFFFPVEFSARHPAKFGELTNLKYVQFPVEKLREKLPKGRWPRLRKVLRSTWIVIWNIVPYILSTLLLILLYCAFSYVFGVEIVFDDQF